MLGLPFWFQAGWVAVLGFGMCSECEYIREHGDRKPWEFSRSVTGPDPLYHLRDLYLEFHCVIYVWHFTMCDRIMMAVLLTVGRDSV